MSEQVLERWLADVRREYVNQKQLAEKAIAQLNDEQFFHTLDAEANSVAVILKHVGGNLRSRWTDVLTTDGEKPDRNRDGEFIADNETRASIMRTWETGFEIVDAALAALEPMDANATVTIRLQEMPLFQAIDRSLAHTAHHVGQIVLLAKHLCGPNWKTLSIPRGKSAEFMDARAAATPRT